MPNVNMNAAKKPVGEKEMTALKKAKKLEESRIRRGWRYYKISNRFSVLIPFDKRKGTPTEKGMRIIEIQKELLGIK